MKKLSPREKIAQQLHDLIATLIRGKFLDRDIKDLHRIAHAITACHCDPALAYRCQEMAVYWDNRGQHARANVFCSAFYYIHPVRG